jgi:prepilin peptidase CpaA
MSVDPSLFDIVLVMLLVAAALSDISTRLIPNLLVGTGMVLALGSHFALSGVAGLVFSLKGLALGMALLIIPFFMGGMGAGDVKLLGMVGAFLGPDMVWNAFLWTALIGGAAALIYITASGRLLVTLKRLLRPLVSAFLPWASQFLCDIREKREPALYLPYGVIISLGTLAAYWKGW